MSGRPFDSLFQYVRWENNAAKVRSILAATFVAASEPTRLRGRRLPISDGPARISLTFGSRVEVEDDAPLADFG